MASYGGDGSAARQMVSGPATGLMVGAIIGIVAQILGVIVTLAAPAMLGEQAQQMMATGPLAIALGVLGIVIGVVVIIGAQKMKNLQSWGFALTVSILSMIPYISPCCCIGLPIGIWAVVVLVKPEVKGAFTA